jgi:hypothetical protein
LLFCFFFKDTVVSTGGANQPPPMGDQNTVFKIHLSQQT